MQKSWSNAIKRLVGNQQWTRNQLDKPIHKQLISLNIGAKEHGTVLFLKTDKK